MNKWIRGYTLTELVIVIGLISIFLGFITVNLVSYQRNASFFSVSESLISDIRMQQMKAMVGDTEARSAADDYGIYFGTNSYTLFHGNSYNASDPANTVITLDAQYQFTLSGRTFVFLRSTGEVRGYQVAQNSVTLRETLSGTQKTLVFNRLGVPKSFE